jgi:hypothetical protein
MDIAEVQTYLDTNKDLPEVKSYIGGLVSPDRVTAYLDSEDGKKLLQPRLDTYQSKGLKTWQDNNLTKMVDEEVKKRFPDADPKDVAMAQLKAEFENMKNSTLKEKLTNKTLKQFQELKLPNELVDFIVSDEESTKKNIEMLKNLFATHDEAIKTEFAKAHSYTPPNGDKSALAGDEKARAEIAKYMK